MTTLNDEKYRFYRLTNSLGSRNDAEREFLDEQLVAASETGHVNDRWRQIFTELGQTSNVRNDGALEFLKDKLIADNQINDAEHTFYEAA